MRTIKPQYAPKSRRNASASDANLTLLLCRRRRPRQRDFQQGRRWFSNSTCSRQNKLIPKRIAPVRRAAATVSIKVDTAFESKRIQLLKPSLNGVIRPRAVVVKCGLGVKLSAGKKVRIAKRRNSAGRGIGRVGTRHSTVRCIGIALQDAARAIAQRVHAAETVRMIKVITAAAVHCDALVDVVAVGVVGRRAARAVVLLDHLLIVVEIRCSTSATSDVLARSPAEWIIGVGRRQRVGVPRVLTCCN